MTALTGAIKETLQDRGINIELAEKLGLHTLPIKGGGECLAIPFNKEGAVVNRKFRTFGEKKRFWQEANGQKCFWNEDVLRDDSLIAQPLIITEGEMDALVALQCGFARTVSVPDGAPAKQIEQMNSLKYSYIETARPLLKMDRVMEIILAVDSDGPGTNLLHDLAVRLNKARCKWVKYPRLPGNSGERCKDLNDVLLHYGQKGVVETLSKARWMKIDGVYSMNDLPPQPEALTFDIGFNRLRDHYKVRLGDFAVVTGIPSHGKSTFVNDMCCRLVTNHGLHVAFASFEQNPQGDHRRNLRTWYCEKPVDHINPEKLAEADRWIDDSFTFLVPNDDDDVTLDWMLDRMEAAVVQRGAHVVVVDPWNELDHARELHETATEYTGRAIKSLKRFAKKFNVHLIVVAHPAKQQKQIDGGYGCPTMYDIADSSHWYNKPDVGMAVHRQVNGDTMIRVIKSRYHDQIGTPGEVFAHFHFTKRRYEVF